MTIIEIASNDGTFLKPFITNGFKKFWCRSSKNICELANKNNIPTVNDYWSNDLTKLSQETW